jgi:hypothetical protein
MVARVEMHLLAVWGTAATFGRVFLRHRRSLCEFPADVQRRGGRAPVLKRLFRTDRLCSDGRTLPSFVTDELHDFLGCGILARGLAQLFCPTCHERSVVG